MTSKIGFNAVFQRYIDMIHINLLVFQISDEEV